MYACFISASAIFSGPFERTARTSSSTSGFQWFSGDSM